MRTLLVAFAFLAGCSRSVPTRSAEGACGEGSTIVLGTCVSYRAADAFCGKTATPSAAGACVRKTCAPGEALDVDHGMCLPESAVLGMLGRGERREDDPPQRATCQYGWLASRNGQLACVTGPLSCGRGERWVKPAADAGLPEIAGRCESASACGVGEIFDEIGGKCARVVRNGQVDLGNWARLALGTDSAEGTNAFCAPVRALGARAHFDVQITVPDNDVTRASARLIGTGVPAASTDAAEHALEELVEMLHFYGGASLAASASLAVTCTPPGTMSPTLELVGMIDGGKR
jgi:hypothetical protein